MRALALLVLLASPALAHEFDRGGPLCDPNIPWSMCKKIDAQAGAVKRLDGWYMSAATMWLGYSKACIVKGSDTQFLFHAIHAGPQRTGNPWEGIITDDPVYRMWMSQTSWGGQIYAAVRRRGWLDTPEYHTLTGEEAVALGAPVCR